MNIFDIGGSERLAFNKKTDQAVLTADGKLIRS
jgi:hypothetical protein